MRIDRVKGAEIIAAMAKDIGKENGLVISECIWDLGTDVDLSDAHRLDISTATKTVRIYLPDEELTTIGNDVRKQITEGRLLRAISQLLPPRTFKK